jgi:hypothetical protein
MKRSETAIVLAKIALVDNRRLDPPDADLSDPMSTPILSAWHELIGHLQMDDCLQAVVRHRQTSTDWVLPVHVIRLVQEIRVERLTGVTAESIAEDLALDGDDPLYLAKIQARYREIADGNRPAPLRAIGGAR